MRTDIDTSTQSVEAPARLRDQGERRYYAHLPGGSPDAVAREIEQLIDLAFDGLGARRLKVRVERLTTT